MSDYPPLPPDESEAPYLLDESAAEVDFIDEAALMDEDSAVQPMQPVRRHLLYREGKLQTARQREPISEVIERLKEVQAQEEIEVEPRSRRNVDPLYAFLFLVALAVGLSPLSASVVYVMTWGLMGGLGALGYVLGSGERLGDAKPEDVFWGLVFGFLASAPFLLVFGSTLETVSRRMFDVEGTPASLMDTWVFMAVVFVIPAVESLFFRSAVQEVTNIFITPALATLWMAALFFPHMELGGRSSIALVLLLVFSLLNFLYSYVRWRNGLASAWLCQVVSYLMLWFLPRVL